MDTQSELITLLNRTKANEIEFYDLHQKRIKAILTDPAEAQRLKARIDQLMLEQNEIGKRADSLVSTVKKSAKHRRYRW